MRLEFSDCSDVFLPVSGLLFLSDITSVVFFNISSKEVLLSGLSFLLAQTKGSEWKEEDKLLIDCHIPSVVRPPNASLEDICLSTILSPTEDGGVEGFKIGGKGKVGLRNGEEGAEEDFSELEQGDLFLSAD